MVSAPASATGDAISPVAAFCQRHFQTIAAAILILAALNVSVRLGRESVADWDEALYALSAAEMVKSGDLVGTTRTGALDYYNAKPPLNVWLIAASFKTFGTGLVSMRLVSAISAWLTVLVLMLWARRTFGATVALAAGAVLATNFGFVHVHAGRSGDTDALLTLLLLVTVVTLWRAVERPGLLVWLGPLLAAIFLLKGMTVVLAIGVVAAALLASRKVDYAQARNAGIAAALFILPVALWMAARWQVDGWEFIGRVVYSDAAGHAFSVLDGHANGPLFYLNLLQKNEYGWLIAAAVALACCPAVWRQGRAALSAVHAHPGRAAVIAWALITVGAPTLMQTKLPWYINPFYPAFALGIGWTIAQAMSFSSARRAQLVAGVAVLVFLVAESRLAWYSFEYRDLAGSTQAMMLAERTQLQSRVVFAQHWPHGDRFVVRDLVGGTPQKVGNVEEFLARCEAGDYLLWPSALSNPTLTLVRSNGRQWLYRSVVP